MSTSHQQPGKDYADKDIRLKPILVFSFYIGLFTVGVFAGTRYLFAYWERQAAQTDTQAAPFTQQRVLPPEPRLQTNEKRTLAEQRAHEDQLLTTYGWADKGQQLVRLPVARALDLVAERGLPARAGAK